jgi:transposase
MEGMGKKPRRRRSFTPEFKAEIVELCQLGDRTVGQVAKDFDLTETAVREWVKQAERDAGTGDGGLTSDERQELAELRRENRRLREDVDILKRATAFFALRRPGELLPVHRGGEVAAAQRQTGVRAAEGLQVRLLHSTRGPAVTAGRAGRRAGRLLAAAVRREYLAAGIT